MQLTCVVSCTAARHPDSWRSAQPCSVARRLDWLARRSGGSERVTRCPARYDGQEDTAARLRPATQATRQSPPPPRPARAPPSPHSKRTCKESEDHTWEAHMAEGKCRKIQMTAGKSDVSGNTPRKANTFVTEFQAISSTTRRLGQDNPSLPNAVSKKEGKEDINIAQSRPALKTYR